MWLAFAVGSAFFAGITAILAKCGIRNIDSTVATAVRTIVVLVFAWAMVFIVGSQDQLPYIDPRTMAFLVLSGLATGASWLCYFKALELGDVNKVVPIDKSSIVLAIVLALIFLGESISVVGVAGVVAISAGTMLMIERKDAPVGSKGQSWLLFAVGSAFFAALTSILGKVGIEGIESNLGTAIRTVVVLAMSWVMVFVTRKQSQVRGIPRKELGFVLASGVATGASWLCFYRALQEGPASVVLPIYKLSILVTIVFSFLVLGERLTRRSLFGLALIVAGTMLMVI
ncbi:EamA family transporter [Candidatus Methanoprimaticola sp. MG2]|uniref:EamA family transporter n=1 Tax=Candidatus Methanoprimaticola sp. MG2 TaxID=3228838 RepID=UPI0039C75AD7